MLESENQVENAATEDVSQTDIDDDVELMESEARIRLKMQKTTFEILTLQQRCGSIAITRLKTLPTMQQKILRLTLTQR